MSKNIPARSSHIENISVDQVSASYMAPGSVKARYLASATKQTIPIDGAFQNPTKTNCRASPETQISKRASKYFNI